MAKYKNVLGGYLGVEAFFMISGFLLGKTINRRESVDVIPLALNKAKKIWFPYATALIVLYVVLCLKNTDFLGLSFQGLKELLMLQEIVPFYTNYEINGPTWYISAMLIATVIISSIEKWLPKLNNAVIISISIFCSLVMFVTCGDLHTHGVLVVVPKGVIRALASMGVGYVAYDIRLRMRKGYCAILWALSVVLSLLVCLIVRDSFLDYLIIPCAFGIVVFGVCFSFKQDTINQCTKILGEISLYIYLWHTLVRHILNEILLGYSLTLYLGVTIVLAVSIFLINLSYSCRLR